MRTNPIIVQVFAGALLASVLIAPAQPAAAQGTKNAMLPGAELLHKFPSEVYRIPLLLEAKDGPRLLVWVDAFDPAPKPKFPMDTLPSPVFDLIVWDVPAKSQVGKLAYPKENAPLSPMKPRRVFNSLTWPRAKCSQPHRSITRKPSTRVCCSLQMALCLSCTARHAPSRN
jgi:hypothetical protein